MGNRARWMRIAAAVSSGLLVAGSCPPLDFTWLAWVGMLPLLWALWSIKGGRVGWKGFGIGYLAGLTACLIQFHWMASVSWLGALILPMYLAVYWGIFGIFAAKFGCSGKPLTVAFCTAAVWAGTELLRGWVITGISWNVLGVAFHDSPWMAQAADLLGVVGLSLMLVFYQSMIVLAWQRRNWRPLAIAGGIVVLLAGYGFMRIRMEMGRESITLRTLLVQLNIPQDASRMLWTDLQTHQGYEDETLAGLKAAKTAPDWVMWPEIALTGQILTSETGEQGQWQINIDTIEQVRAGGRFELIYGAMEWTADLIDGQLFPRENGPVYNSLAVLSPDDVLQTYHKEHLVIFGETIPFVDSLPFLKKIYEEQSGAEYSGSFAAGDKFDPLPIAVGKQIVGAIPTVCFEDSVPRLMRRFIRPGPQVIINVTNDGWFKQSAAAAQHFEYARFRAIEFRRPMLRCANNGVSAAIDTTGSTMDPETGKSQILTDANGSHFTRGNLLTVLKIPRHPSFSLYAFIGDWGIIALSALALLFWFRQTRLNPKRLTIDCSEDTDFKKLM